MITIKPLHSYIGPNIHASKPVVEIALEIPPDMLASSPQKIALINRYFLNWFSWQPTNSPLTIHDVAEFLVRFAQAMLNEISGSVDVAHLLPDTQPPVAILGYHHPQVSVQALSTAAHFFLTIESMSVAQINETMQPMWNLCARFHPDFQAQFLIDYCQKHDIPCRAFMLENRYWQYGAGKRSVILFESSPLTDNAKWTQHKPFSKEVFKKLGAPVAKNVLVSNEDQLEQAVKQVGFPCVTKPIDMQLGQGVLTNHRDMASVIAGFKHARKVTSGSVMVESYVTGEIHRILVIRGKYWMTVRRDRPFVIGDGTSTVKALVEQFNAPILSRLTPGATFGPVPIDVDFHTTLKGQGMQENHIPAKGQKVVVRGVATSKQASNYVDVSALIHPDTKLMSETLAKTFGIDACGIDYITDDISVSCFQRGAFIEINTTPGLRTPERVGASREEIAKIILGPVPARIPVALVIASTQHHEDIKKSIPDKDGIGWVVGTRLGIGTAEFSPETATHLCVEKLLRNCAVSALVIICDADSITALGMPIDKAHTSIMYADAQLDSKWQEVLAKNSTTLLQCDAPAKLGKLLAEITDVQEP